MVRRTRIASVVVTSVLSACAEGETLPGFDTDAPDLGTAGVPMPDGYSWCARAIGAEIIIPGQPNEPVQDPDDGDQAPKGCECVSTGEHAALDLLDNDNDWSVIVDSMQPPDLRVERNAAFIAAVLHCHDVAEEQSGGLYEDTCDEVFDGDEDPIFIEELDANEEPFLNCHGAGERIGDSEGMEPPPEDSYTDYYSLSMVITYNAAKDKYFIDTDFYRDVLDNPGWLLADGARVAAASSGSPPYEFVGVTTTDVVYALGIRNGDRPISVNGLSVDDGLHEVLEHYEEITGALAWNFVLKRGTNTITLSYGLD